jgi:hypothetical protein
MKNPARTVDLGRMYRITYTSQGSPRKLSARAKRWFRFFQGLTKLGHDGITAPIGAVIDAERRSADQTCSKSTTFRALAELQAANLISRPRKPAGITEIEFQPALFVSYLSIPVSKCFTSYPAINPEIRSARRSTQIPDRISDRISQPEKKSRSPHRYDASEYQSLLPAPAISPPGAPPPPVQSTAPRPASFPPAPHSPPTPIRRQPPPLFSCRKVATQADRPAVLALAAGEYADRRRRRPTRSGIDWNRETDRWQLMTIAEREHVARLELLPALRSALTDHAPEAPDLDDMKNDAPGCPRLPDLDFGYILAPPPKADRPPPVELRLDLAAGDLAILLAARDRIRRTG